MQGIVSIVSFILCSAVSSKELPGVGKGEHYIEILPSEKQEVRVGRNLVLTCKARVSNQELIRDLKWTNPQGVEIPQDGRIYSENQPEEAAIALFIKKLSEEDAGDYKCSAVYASNHEIEASVEVFVFIGITWEDAPASQFAIASKNFKVRCVVKANPPANIDWMKDAHIITTGDQYVIETDGLLIKNVSENNIGTYTCRARVPQTGELEERDVNLDVLRPPTWLFEPSDVRGVESDTTELVCKASGNPEPSYTWIDWEGIDATRKPGWVLDEITGRLTVSNLDRRDAGQYKCIAENNAGRIEAKATLDIIIKPKVQELFNQTYSEGMNAANITCKASGDPLPNIIWKKWSKNEAFSSGLQKDDSRVFVEETIIDAPDYTEGERQWRKSTIMINKVNRSDDGLYECKAENEAGMFFKSGHITVEFGPTFEDQLVSQEWSWSERPVALRCIATSIPNATISWWYTRGGGRELEIGRDDPDQNFEVIGHGPYSDLKIVPRSSKYYGKYICKAQNPHGSVRHDIKLEEARIPSVIQQVVFEKVTATTLEIRFVPPADHGGLPLDAFAVEYKETRHDWNDAKRRVWAIADNGNYFLEDLSPRTTLDLRFACRNRVGFSTWSAGKHIEMEDRGHPEPPTFIDGLGSIITDEETGQTIEMADPSSFDVSWQIPEDNGLPIDYFYLRFYPVRKDKTGSAEWIRVGDIIEKTIPNRGSVRYSIDLQHQDNYYMIILQAHNELGYSEEGTKIIKSGKEKPSEEAESEKDITLANIPLLPVIGGIMAVLILILILIDISCCVMNNVGLMYTMCGKKLKKEPGGKENSRNKTHKNNVEKEYQVPSDIMPSFHSKEHGSMGKLATIKSGNRTLERRDQGKVYQFLPVLNGDNPRFSQLYGGDDENIICPSNLYEATPDHSILKNGMAKSLSVMDIAENGSNERKNEPIYINLPAASDERYRSEPGFVKRRNKNTKSPGQSLSSAKKKSTKKMEIRQFEPRQSLPSLVGDLNVLTANYNKIAQSTNCLMVDSSESSVSNDEKSIENFQGFKKTRDFGEFVVYSDSPDRSVLL